MPPPFEALGEAPCEEIITDEPSCDVMPAYADLEESGEYPVRDARDAISFMIEGPHVSLPVLMDNRLGLEGNATVEKLGPRLSKVTIAGQGREKARKALAKLPPAFEVRDIY